MRNRRSLAMLLFIALAATTLATSTVLGDSPKVIELFTERRDLLAQRLKLLEAQHALGEAISWKDLVEARDELFAAELTLVTTKPRRVEILTSGFENLKSTEELDTVQMHNGDASTAHVLKAKRLAAEVDVNRAIKADL